MLASLDLFPEVVNKFKINSILKFESRFNPATVPNLTLANLDFMVEKQDLQLAKLQLVVCPVAYSR